MKKYINFLLAISCMASFMLTACDRSEFDFDTNLDGNRADSSLVTVDTLQGIDVSMYEKARIFPGLVDTTTERRVADTIVSFDLSRKYVSMGGLNLKYSASNGTPSTGSTPQPIYSTGLYAGAGEKVTITVPGNVWGLTAQIGMQTDDLTKNTAGLREPIVYVRKSLFPGENTIRCPFGGYIWIIRDDEAQGDADTQIGFKNVYSAPDFVLGKTNPQEWSQKLKNTTVPWLDIRSKRIAISIDRSHVLQYLDSNPNYGEELQETLQLWDNFMLLFFDCYGLDENATDVSNMVPQYPERFIFDVQLANNGLTKITNPQGITMVKASRFYNNLLVADSLKELRFSIMKKLLDLSYVSPSSFAYGSYVPLYRFAEQNYQNGVTKERKDAGLNLEAASQYALKYAAEDSVKNGERWYPWEFKGSNAQVEMLRLMQVVKYGEKYRGEEPWAFYKYMYRTYRSKGSIDMFRTLCSYYMADFTPFYEHWGITLSDEEREYARRYNPINKEIWKINPFAADPFKEVGDFKGIMRYRVNRAGWSILAVDGEGNINEDRRSSKEQNWCTAQKLIDGSLSSYWYSHITSERDSPYELPYYIIIDMGKEQSIDGFYFANGSQKLVSHFIVQTTNDSGFELEDHANQTWIPLGEVNQTLVSWRKNEQYFKFLHGSHKVRYLRLVFDKPNLMVKTEEDLEFELLHKVRRQALSEFGVYSYQR